LHIGLWDLDFEDWQHFIPLMVSMPHDFIDNMFA